ncbi:MAG: hypothetical protein ABJQ14_10760, partial [Hyphomicrobiales bacterium]
LYTRQDQLPWKATVKASYCYGKFSTARFTNWSKVLLRLQSFVHRKAYDTFGSERPFAALCLNDRLADRAASRNGTNGCGIDL